MLSAILQPAKSLLALLLFLVYSSFLDISLAWGHSKLPPLSWGEDVLYKLRNVGIFSGLWENSNLAYLASVVVEYRQTTFSATF